MEQFGAPANEQVLVLPLVLKDKVAALVYADAGADGTWIRLRLNCWSWQRVPGWKVISLRKQTQREIVRLRQCPRTHLPSPPVQTVSSFPIPSLATRPSIIAPSVSVEPEPGATAEVVEMPGSGHTAGAAAPAAAADPFAGLSPEDADVPSQGAAFRPACSSMKSKLYNQAKVTEDANIKIFTIE